VLYISMFNLIACWFLLSTTSLHVAYASDMIYAKLKNASFLRGESRSLLLFFTHTSYNSNMMDILKVAIFCPVNLSN
jgi:hypothetical protein